MIGRLALYSDQIVPQTDEIDRRVLSWLPSSARIGYLPSSPDPERTWFQPRADHYRRYGHRLEFFGLEDEFDAFRTDDIQSCEAIHLSGGNTYRFLYWLRQRGLIQILRNYVADGGVLIGVSAGAILMTPDIQSSSLCGDTLYPGLEDDFTGLGLVAFAVVPHFDGSLEHENGIVRYSRTFRGLVCAVPDGAGIILDRGRCEFLGPVLTMRAGAWLRGSPTGG